MRLFGVALLGAVAAGFLAVPVLVVEGESQRWVRPMLPGSSFCLEFLHSVERTPVQDCFRVSWKGELVLMRTIYSSYGAGLPAEGKLTAGQFVLEHNKTPIPELVVRVSPEAQLQVGGTRVSLTKLAPLAGTLRLRVLRPWHLLFGT